jgi:hypothetical protein
VVAHHRGGGVEEEGDIGVGFGFEEVVQEVDVVAPAGFD